MTKTPVADIVEEIREAIANCSGNEPSLSVLCRAADQAADEITRLRAREAELQCKLDEAVKALRRIHDAFPASGSHRIEFMRSIALSSIRGEG